MEGRERPGRQQGQEGESSTGQGDGRMQLCRWPERGSGSRANPSVQERRAPEQHPQHGVEGRAPHRAEAFVAMRRSEDRTPYHRHDNRAVANTTRYLEGGTSRTLTGPEGAEGQGGEQDKGETQRGENGRIRSNPKQQKQKNAQSNRGTHKLNNTRHTEQAETNNRPKDTGPSTPPGKDNENLVLLQFVLLEVGLSCIRLFVCRCPVALSLARLSCSVRGVGTSRREPWTRLHLPEQFWGYFPCDCARLRNYFPVAAAGRLLHNVLLTLYVVRIVLPRRPGTAFISASDELGEWRTSTGHLPCLI